MQTNITYVSSRYQVCVVVEEPREAHQQGVDLLCVVGVSVCVSFVCVCVCVCMRMCESVVLGL